jgi:hypothetical protein
MRHHFANPNTPVPQADNREIARSAEWRVTMKYVKERRNVSLKFCKNECTNNGQCPKLTSSDAAEFVGAGLRFSPARFSAPPSSVLLGWSLADTSF